PITVGLREGVEALIVLAAGLAVAFLPAQWTVARSTEGIAGAAALGLVGTVVFSAIDIVLLRPFKAYPWTWDAIGGGSTWWYLPVWWMLGTFVAWMGGIVTAAGGETILARRVLPAVGSPRSSSGSASCVASRTSCPITWRRAPRRSIAPLPRLTEPWRLAPLLVLPVTLAAQGGGRGLELHLGRWYNGNRADVYEFRTTSPMRGTF